ncbi:MAG: T9SS type A sorting domain-containing protein [Bacteroidetes bacterium]|nr:MAG: T9SS type A sorting domain-containing protein [Bacteroidota bacterium]
MKKALILLSLFLGGSFAQAQMAKNYVEGDLLVRFYEDDPATLRALQEEFKSMNLKAIQLLSDHMNIWKFTYDPESADIEKAIWRLSGSKLVHTVQRNHILELRKTPNDAQYDQQWQYFQSNDRDIDADLAWDMTTGGLTANGDTIVVCVIDDGVNSGHPDLQPNLWRNYHEIPGNNIDDDGNGYIDDFLGWNSKNNTNNPEHSSVFDGHGSAVAGIVGAKGNNEEGVTGVNWDVKLMIVKGGGNEAQAIAAYSYPLECRKLYNATNGAKGAFVVATNASWGINFGQADNAPLWCAMYDTLGAHGVLNAGATANLNVDVDTDGDLPTQCPSEFLISVTNINKVDQKVSSAGYGLESVDLGAPGEGTWTVDQFSDGYASFGGTSGATPHVAGTIGLMYSIPCNNFADTAKLNPKRAAELVRDMIFNGVDSLGTLTGKTTTGGRLNVNNSIWGLAGMCGFVNTKEIEAGKTNSYQLYPNPYVNGALLLKIESVRGEKMTWTMFDLTGKKVLQEMTYVQEGSQLIPLEVDQLPAGVYRLELRSESQVKTISLIRR